MKKLMCIAAAVLVCLSVSQCRDDDDDGGDSGVGIDAALVGTWDRVVDNPESGYIVATDSDILVGGTSLSTNHDPYNVVNAESGQIYLTASGTNFAGVYPPSYLYDYLIAGDTLYMASDLSDTLKSGIRNDLTTIVCVKQ